MARTPGTKTHKPTKEKREQIKMLAAFGITQEHIAKKFGISVDTLVKYYRAELDLGLVDAINEVANALYTNAVIDKNPTSMMFFLKTRGGWSEKRDDNTDALKSVVEMLLKSKES